MEHVNIEIGKKYRIRPNFRDIDIERGRHPGFSSDMDLYAGQEVTVERRCDGDPSWFKVTGNSWTWHSDWLEPLELEVEYSAIGESELIDIFNQ